MNKEPFLKPGCWWGLCSAVLNGGTEPETRQEKWNMEHRVAGGDQPGNFSKTM